MKRNTLYMQTFFGLFLSVVFLFFGFTTSSASEKYGGTLTLGWTQGPDSLNPLTYETVQAGLLFRSCIYETIVGIGKESLEPVPLLAKSWQPNKDGTVWTFNLEDGIKWHDGEAFSSEDVKFTIEYIKHNEIPGLLSYVEAIDKVETPNESTIKVYYEKPVATALYDLQSVWIIPEHKWKHIQAAEGEEKKGPLTFPNKNPIGTGPFKFVKWEKQAEVVLQVNKDYWQGRPYLDKLVFRYFSNTGGMLLALKSGTIDVIPWEIPPTMVEDLTKVPEIKVAMNDNLYYRWINFNVSGGGNPALTNRKVRLALNHAIDREFLGALIHRGYTSPGVQIVQKASGYWFNDKLKPYEFDLEHSKQLLEEAGYTNLDNDGVRKNKEGMKLDFTLMVINRWPEELKAAEQIKQWWNKIGVKLNVQSAEAGTILSKTVPLEHDMYLWGFSGNPDPTFSLNIMLERQIKMWNGSGYANPVYDALFDAQRKEVDPKDRQKMIYHMQKIVHNDAPHAVLYYMKSIGAYRGDRFTGFVDMPTGIVSQLNAYSLKNVCQTN